MTLDDIETKARELAAEHPGPYRAGPFEDSPDGGDFVLYGAEPGDIVLWDAEPGLVRYLATLSPDVTLQLVARLRAAEAVCRAVGPIDPVAYERWRAHVLDE